MICTPILLPSDWIERVKNYDINKIENELERCIVINIKNFVLDKKETILGARFVQKFLDAVIKEKNSIFTDFTNIPCSIIHEAFSEIKGERGLQFCEKFDSIITELIAFQEILKKENFAPVEKQRADGQSDFFIKKHCLEYEAEVKFKMEDQAFHDSITHLIMGYSMLLSTHCLIGKKISIKIKLSPSDITHENKSRIYKKVEQWCKSQLFDISDDDVDITIENGSEKVLKIECGENTRIACVPTSDEVATILKSHMQTIKKQFEKRNPKRSIGIIVWATPFNYDSEERKQIEANIVDGIQSEIDSIGFICNRLYIYPTTLKKSLLFKSKKGQK